jgi:hypothetical protein
MNTHFKNHRSIFEACASVLLYCFHLLALAQEINPNNLSSCPPQNLSNSRDVGVGGRTEKWNKCWGKYVFQIDAAQKGNYYEGEWIDGLGNGYGIFNSSSGFRYYGNFKNFTPNGYGVYKWESGATYSGDLVNGRPHGFGIMYNSDGSTYIGEHKIGKYDGQGIHTSKNGRQQEGIWKEGNLVANVNVDVQKIEKKSSTRTEPSAGSQNLKQFLKRTNPNNLAPCPVPDQAKKKDVGVSGRTEQWKNCWGRYEFVVIKDLIGTIWEGEWQNGLLDGYGGSINRYGDVYVGNFLSGDRHGFGISNRSDGSKYVGEFSNDGVHGYGVDIEKDGSKREGVWANAVLIRESKIDFSTMQHNSIALRDYLAENGNENRRKEDLRRLLENEKIQREQQRQNQRVNLQVTHTQPAADGSFTINVQTNTDTASLLVNGSEEGGRLDGSYSIKRIARAGQDTKFEIKVKDIYGNTDTKTITVAREVIDSAPRFAELDPGKIKSRPTSDAVAIIIGIHNYKRVLKADYANDDARAFYDYAIRALGIKPENIKLLIDDQADEVEILGAFQNWLPIKVKKLKTDVYVFYSGHGLPSEDGKSLYILPFGADKQFIDRTAINQQEIIRSLQSVQAKSVTMFMDACYSGQIRTGDTLIASARPVSLKTSNNLFPPEFTVFSASSPDQIASSSPALKHGIFSYFVMKGMEGDADENKDGRITVDELHAYLSEMVSKQALSLNRKQSPQLIGTSGKILVNR